MKTGNIDLLKSSYIERNGEKMSRTVLAFLIKNDFEETCKSPPVGPNRSQALIAQKHRH